MTLQYKDAIHQAKQNLKSASLLPTQDGYQGAARMPEKTVEEVAAEHEKRKITV